MNDVVDDLFKSLRQKWSTKSTKAFWSTIEWKGMRQHSMKKKQLLRSKRSKENHLPQLVWIIPTFYLILLLRVTEVNASFLIVVLENSRWTLCLFSVASRILSQSPTAYRSTDISTYLPRMMYLVLNGALLSYSVIPDRVRSTGINTCKHFTCVIRCL